MQQAGDDRGRVELHLREQTRDLDRVREIRVARSAQLRTVRLHRIDIGTVERGLVGLRVVGLDQLDQFELPHHDAVAFVLSPCCRPSSGQAGRRGAGRLIGRDAVRRAIRREWSLASGLLVLAKRALGAGVVGQIDVVFVRYRKQILFEFFFDRFLIDRILGDDGAGRIGDAEQCLLEIRRFLGLVDLDMLLHAAHERILR